MAMSMAAVATASVRLHNPALTHKSNAYSTRSITAALHRRPLLPSLASGSGSIALEFSCKNLGRRRLPFPKTSIRAMATEQGEDVSTRNRHSVLSLGPAFLIAKVWWHAVSRVGHALIEALTATPLPSGRLAEKELVTSLKGRLLLGAGPLLFAAISQPGSVSTPLTVVASGMAKWLELYSGVLMVRVLLSWFPNIPWERQPLQAVRDMCDPYLNLFRNIIPPLFNALDLSPMLAFMVLGVLTSILNTTVQG